MAGRVPSRKNNWPIILTGLGVAWTIFFTIAGIVWASAYVDGVTASAIRDLDRRVTSLEQERRRPDGGTR